MEEDWYQQFNFTDGKQSQKAEMTVRGHMASQKQSWDENPSFLTLRTAHLIQIMVLGTVKDKHHFQEFMSSQEVRYWPYVFFCLTHIAVTVSSFVCL